MRRYAKLVMKFGGSLVGSRGGTSRIADIVSSHAARNRIVVVVSALGDVTDVLLNAAKKAPNWDQEEISKTMDGLRRTHLRAVAQISLGPTERSALVEELEGLLTGLGTTLTGVSKLGELSPRSKDVIVSHGERMAAPIVAAAIRSKGLESWAVTGGVAGIITDRSFGEASPDTRATRRALRQSLLKPLAKGEVPVVTGFIARSKDGETTTLGRGGSDYTATIIGDALGADEVWIWTDVDGILTGDPRVVKKPRVVQQLSYAEAEELAFFGAKRMHPLALGPAKLARIPVRIKNGFRPQAEGTLIVERPHRTSEVMKCAASVKDVGLLTVSTESLRLESGIAAKVFSALGTAKVEVLMVSQSVSEASLCMVVRRSALPRAKASLLAKLARDNLPFNVEADPHIAVVAVVGAGMRGTKGIAARVFHGVASRGINVRMIAQGSSELSISFVVDSSKADTAVSALHDLVVGGGRS